jgi:hypothetical protein
MRLRAWNLSRPAKAPAASVIFAWASMTTISGRPRRLPAAKSLGSCAGVTLTAPVPNVGSTNGSATTGTARPVSGTVTVRPIAAL